MYMMFSQNPCNAGGIYGVDGIYGLSTGSRLGYGVPEAGNLDDDSLARVARTLVVRHFVRLGGLDELAAMLNVERNALATAFHAKYGMAVDACIMREKLKMAQRLLVQTSQGLPEIARRLGFNHPSAFATFFRELVGITPWSFRQLPYPEQIAAIAQ